MLNEFLDFLYGNLKGWVYAPVKENSGEWNQAFFFWPAQKDRLVSHIKTKSADKADVYIAPAIFSTNKAEKQFVKAANVLWVDQDGNYTGNFKGLPEPSLIIQSSLGSRAHCYWKLPEPVGPEVLDDLNRRIAYYLQADTSGWDANQVLRPPETINWKYGDGQPVQVKRLESDVYDQTPFIGLPEIEAFHTTVQELQLLDPQEVLTSVNLPPELYLQVTKEMVHSPHRSSFMMKVAMSLAENNCTLEQILALLTLVDDRIEKYKNRSDRLHRLVTLAAQALTRVSESGNTNQPTTVALLSPSDILNPQEQLEFLIPGWLHSKGFMIISGAPGVGKTQMGIDMLYHFIDSSKFLDKDINLGKHHVLFYSLEMQPVELRYIFELQKEKYNFSNYDDFFHIHAPLEGHNMAYLEAIVEKLGVRVLLIDSLSEMFEDEMKEKEAREVMRALTQLRHKFNCAVILIHHNRKASDSNKKPNKLSDLYGSYIFAKSVDTVVVLWEDNAKLELLDVKTRFGQKQNRFVERTEFLTFELREGGKKTDVGKPEFSLGGKADLSVG